MPIYLLQKPDLQPLQWGDQMSISDSSSVEILYKWLIATRIDVVVGVGPSLYRIDFGLLKTVNLVIEALLLTAFYP